MKNENGVLLFDEKSIEKLENNNTISMCDNVNILRKWVTGIVLTDIEERTIEKNVIFYPDTFDEIDSEWLNLCLNRTQLAEPINPERALVLYHLVYYHLTTGNIEIISDLFNDLKNIFNQYEESGVRIFSIHGSPLKIIDKISDQNEQSYDVNLLRAYFNILSKIILQKNLLNVTPGFRFEDFPVPNDLKDKRYFPEYELTNLRVKALEYFESSNYTEALKLYNFLLISHFEISNTFIHYIRSYLLLSGEMHKTMEQFEVLAAFAYRSIDSAVNYMKVRVLYTLVLIEINSNKGDQWLRCLKGALTLNKSTLFWEFEKVIANIKLDFDQRDLMSSILQKISFNKPIADKYEIWTNLELIPIDCWPKDFEVSHNCEL